MVIKCKKRDFEEGKALKREIKKREKLEAKKKCSIWFLQLLPFIYRQYQELRTRHSRPALLEEWHKER